MNTANPSLFLAFLAGLASFLAPCVLPLVPAYIGYLSGRVVAAPDQRRTPAERLATFLHALAFVLGFSLVFVAMGLAAGGLARLLRSDWVRWIGGLVMIFFGLALTGAVKLPFLYTERRLHIKARPGLGYLSSFLVGLSFAAGWTPCIGPVLGAILALSTNQETVGQAVGMLIAYAAGLGIPFLLVGLALDWAFGLIRRLQRYMNVVQIVMGVILIVFGVLLFMDWIDPLGRWMTEHGLGWDLGL